MDLRWGRSRVRLNVQRTERSEANGHGWGEEGIMVKRKSQRRERSRTHHEEYNFMAVHGCKNGGLIPRDLRGRPVEEGGRPGIYACFVIPVLFLFPLRMKLKSMKRVYEPNLSACR